MKRTHILSLIRRAKHEVRIANNNAQYAFDHDLLQLAADYLHERKAHQHVLNVLWKEKRS